MFDKDQFIQDCVNAVAEGQRALRAVVDEAVSDSADVMAAFGEPEHAGITPLYRTRELTISNFVWAPCMSLMPHNHQMYALFREAEERFDATKGRGRQMQSSIQ